MDIWGLIQRAMGVATLNYAMVGRWAGHLLRGQIAHSSIGKAEPIAGESAWGWFIHYAVGIVFGFLLLAVYGTEWLQDPRWLPAVIVGMATVVMPFFVMQPAMGAGVAASRTPHALDQPVAQRADTRGFWFGHVPCGLADQAGGLRRCHLLGPLSWVACSFCASASPRMPLPS